MENWYRKGGPELKYVYDHQSEEPNYPDPINDGIGWTNQLHEFGPDDSYIFTNWEQNTDMGEPRDLDINISHYISHIDIANAGYGYSVPAEVH